MEYVFVVGSLSYPVVLQLVFLLCSLERPMPLVLRWSPFLLFIAVLAVGSMIGGEHGPDRGYAGLFAVFFGVPALLLAGNVLSILALIWRCMSPAPRITP